MSATKYVLFNDSNSRDPGIAAANRKLVDEINESLRGVTRDVEVRHTASFPEVAALLAKEEVPLVFTNFAPDLTYEATAPTGGTRAKRPIRNYVRSSHWVAGLAEDNPATTFIAITGAYPQVFDDEWFVSLASTGNLGIMRKYDLTKHHNDLQVALGKTVVAETALHVLHDAHALPDAKVTPNPRKVEDDANVFVSDADPLKLGMGEAILDRPLMTYYTLIRRHAPTGIVFLCGGGSLSHLCLNLGEMGIPFRFASLPVEEWDSYMHHPRYLR